jgi:hypothetical protein
MTETLVEIYRAESAVEASLIKAALEGEGIPADITGQRVAALEPNLGWANPWVVVAPGDAPRAAVVIRDFQTAKKPHDGVTVEQTTDQDTVREPFTSLKKAAIWTIWIGAILFASILLMRLMGL